MIQEGLTSQAVNPGDDQQVRKHYQSSKVAIFIPGGQSFLTGVFIGLAALFISWVAGAAKPWLWGLIVWSLVQAWTWITLLQRWTNLVQSLETAIGADINQDGYIGDPVERVRIILDQDDGRKVDIIDLPASKDQLISLADGLLTGSTFSEAAWTGQGSIFSRSQFARLRDELVRRGLLSWNNPNTPARGLSLTPGGKAAMRYFASFAGGVSPTLRADLRVDQL